MQKTTLNLVENQLKPQESEPRPTIKQWSWLPITLILLLATGLYFYQLGMESMWVDELYSISDAKAIPETLPAIRPIYFVLLHLWMKFSTDVTWLRSLSVLFSLGSILLIYLLGRRIAGEAVGLIAALMLTLSPLFINFTQMVRMYSLGTCLGLAGTLALVQALDNPTNKTMAWWAIMRVLMVLTAPLNATLIIADILLFRWRFHQQRRILLRFGKWLIVLIALWLPFLTTLISQTLPFLAGALDVTAKNAASASRHDYPSALEVIRKLKNFTAFPFPSPSKLMSLFYQGYTLMLVGLLALAPVKKHPSPPLLWITTWLLLPAGMIFLVSQRLWVDRYILFLAPYLLILLAAGIVRIWHNQRVVAIGLTLIYFVAVSGGLMRYYTVLDRQDWKGLAQAISLNDQSGDAIILSGGSAAPKMTTGLTYYYRGDAPIIVEPQLCSTSNLKPSQVKSGIDSLPKSASRFWLVCSSEFDPPQLQTWFADKLNLIKHQQFRNENFYRDNDYMHLLLTTKINHQGQEK